MNKRLEFWKKLQAVISSSAYPRTLTEDAFEIYWNMLGGYDMKLLDSALNQHVRNSRSSPAPYDLLQYLPDPFNHPDPETAWNNVPKNEHEGAYVTQEMMSALCACQDSLDRGDYIGARMAFIESYKNNVQYAKQSNQPAKFFFSAPSAGSYEARQDAKIKAIEKARGLRWLEEGRAQKLLSEISECSDTLLTHEDTEAKKRLQSNLRRLTQQMLLSPEQDGKTSTIITKETTG